MLKCNTSFRTATVKANKLEDDWWYKSNSCRSFCVYGINKTRYCFRVYHFILLKPFNSNRQPHVHRHTIQCQHAINCQMTQQAYPHSLYLVERYACTSAMLQRMHRSCQTEISFLKVKVTMSIKNIKVSVLQALKFFVTKIKEAYGSYIVAAFHCILPTGNGTKCVKYRSINVQQDATIHSLFYL